MALALVYLMLLEQAKAYNTAPGVLITKPKMTI